MSSPTPVVTGGSPQFDVTCSYAIGQRSSSISNLHAFAETLGRPLEHIARFIAWKVGCSVVVYPDHVAVAASLAPSAGQELVKLYIEECVRCPGCKSIPVAMSPYACVRCNHGVHDPVPPTTLVAELME